MQNIFTIITSTCNSIFNQQIVRVLSIALMEVHVMSQEVNIRAHAQMVGREGIAKIEVTMQWICVEWSIAICHRQLSLMVFYDLSLHHRLFFCCAFHTFVTESL